VYVGFFFRLRDGGVKVSLKEYLTLLEALARGAHGWTVESFYYLARACLVKDERHFDRFDRVFAAWIEGLAAVADPFAEIPEEWLKKMGERYLTPEEMEQVKAMGGWRELLEELKKRIEKQDGRHQGGSKWVGTGGTSPFGAWGYNPMGIRIGQNESRHRRAVKVWDRREFKDYDDSLELGTRNMKVALRKLRRLTREGTADELDLPGTVRATARNAGYLDLAMQPGRENRVKLLLFLDVGGSMDDHVLRVDQLFSAARAEFKHLEHFYFHNCVYENLWRKSSLRWSERIPTREVLKTYGPDYRVVFVSDASMSPFEFTEPGGAIEHWNEEPGYVWLQRVTAAWERVTWVNPIGEKFWYWTPSIDLIRKLVGGRMVPLTLEGLDRAVGLLRA
jgi:uncharacterized protein with von Willebrand factor type A (vWA) domain